ncbi:MAG: hypothetical protein VKJ02_00610 [Snowella sp.]|nr:hypothetical protein [Snowella sp.]
MTQVFSSGKRLPKPLPKLALSRLSQPLIYALSRPEVYKWGRWTVASFGLTVMLSWDWKLVVATGMGIGGMGLVYLALGENWQKHWLVWRNLLKGSQGKLTLAVGSGGVAAFSTYLAAAIWAESDNRWLATGTILEGVGTLLTLGLLGWHLLSEQNQQTATQLDKLLNQLTEPDPLKRLIAIRQLGKLIEQNQISSRDRHQIEDYFRLLLSQETEPLIQKAILEQLHLEKNQTVRTSLNPPLNVPLNLQPLLKRLEKI